MTNGRARECPSGNEENVNGRRFNWHAGNGDWLNGTLAPGLTVTNLHGRGYTVRVSKNSRDEGYLQNRDNSRNWGSDIHIITHTNGNDGCNTGLDYLETMWAHDADSLDDRALASALRIDLNPYVPGTGRIDQRPLLTELSTNRRWGDAYVELQFHDNSVNNQWLQGESKKYSNR